MTKPVPIQMLWVRKPIPWLAVRSMESFVRQGHVVQLYMYEPDAQLPPGVVLRDASEILDRRYIFEYQTGFAKGSLSGFANWFRYELLARKGGWWADSDMYALTNLEKFQRRLVFASGWEPSQHRFVNNNIIFAERPAEAIFMEASQTCERKFDQVLFAETGPVLLNELVDRHGLREFVTAPGIFNPIHYRDLDLLLKTRAFVDLKKIYRKIRGRRPIDISKESGALHAYTNLLTRAYDLSREELVPKRSLLRDCMTAAPKC